MRVIVKMRAPEAINHVFADVDMIDVQAGVLLLSSKKLTIAAFAPDAWASCCAHEPSQV